MAISTNQLIGWSPTVLSNLLRTGCSQSAAGTWNNMLAMVIEDNAHSSAAKSEQSVKASHVAHPKSPNAAKRAEGKNAPERKSTTLFHLGLSTPNENSPSGPDSDEHGSGVGWPREQSSQIARDANSGGEDARADGAAEHKAEAAGTSTEASDAQAGPQTDPSGSGQTELSFAAALVSKAAIQPRDGSGGLPQTLPPAGLDHDPGADSDAPVGTDRQVSTLPVQALYAAESASGATDPKAAEAVHQQAAAREASPAAEPENRPAGNTPMSEVSIRVADAQGGRVDVRLVDRTGEVRVTVHANNAELTRGLRDSLPELVKGLEHRGYEAEVWRPTDPSASSDGRNHRGPDWGSQGRSGHGNDANPQDRQNGASHQFKDQPQWLDEMQRTFARGTSERSKSK